MVYIPPSSSWTFNSVVFDQVILCCIAALLLLSLISLSFIFSLRLKSRNCHHLQNFNSLWTVRFLLISFISLWALNELLRLPFIRQQYIFSSFPTLTQLQQADLCKIHVVLSLGLFEPGFLVTLLFLVNVSIRKKTLGGWWALVFVKGTCFPVLFLQVLFVFCTTIDIHLPEILQKSWVVSGSDDRETVVLCMYPLISTFIFGAFVIWYLIAFSLSCFKVVTIVINRGLSVRIYGLSLAMMITLPLQIFGLGLSVFWRPEEMMFGGLALLVFVSASLVAAVGEGILVIRPAVDSLAAVGGENWPCCTCNWAQEVVVVEAEGGVDYL